MNYIPYISRAIVEFKNMPFTTKSILRKTYGKNSKQITLVDFKNFIMNGSRALQDIMRLVSLTHSEHPFLSYIKLLPFYHSFKPTHCLDQYKTLTNNKRWTIDSTNDTGYYYLRRKIKLYIRFIQWALPECHKDVKQLRKVYHDNEKINKKITQLNILIDGGKKRVVELQNRINKYNKCIADLNDKCEAKKRKLTLSK